MIDLYTAATPNGQEDPHHARGDRPRLPRQVGGHQPRRSVRAGVPRDQRQHTRSRPSWTTTGPGAGRSRSPSRGAILLYLADKTGRFLPEAPHERWETVQWLMWQMGGFGPMLGQSHHFNAYAPMRPDGPVVLPYAQERYTKEAARLYGVLDKRLEGREYVAAGQYTIADMAIFPWCRLAYRQRQDIESFPNVKRWFDVIAARPAVAKDMEETEDIVDGFSKESWEISFGARQHRQG